jgi:hypothetical protein
VDPIARDDQIDLAEVSLVVDLALELQRDTERPAAALQDLEQAPPPDATEAMPTGANDLAAKVDLDVVPVLEGVANLHMRLRVRRGQVLERLVGEDHAPPERVIGPVALDDAHVVRRVGALHEEREIQARGPTANADDLHDDSPPVHA